MESICLYVLCYINKHGGLSECIDNQMYSREYAINLLHTMNAKKGLLKYVLKKVYI